MRVGFFTRNTGESVRLKIKYFESIRLLCRLKMEVSVKLKSKIKMDYIG